MQYKVDEPSLQILGTELKQKPSEYLSFAKSYILDLGGGPGIFASQLKTPTNHIVSLDIKRELLFMHDNSILSGIEPIVGDALHLPFKDQTFDMILARAVLHHFPNNQFDAFLELFRVLKKGGLLLIEEPGHYNPLACIIRKTISTTSHEKEEIPLIPSELVRRVEDWFSVTEVSYHYLFSYGIANLIAFTPGRFKPTARKILGGLVKLDKILLRHKLFQPFCGYISIVCIKE